MMLIRCLTSLRSMTQSVLEFSEKRSSFLDNEGLRYSERVGVFEDVVEESLIRLHRHDTL